MRILDILRECTRELGLYYYYYIFIDGKVMVAPLKPYPGAGDPRRSFEDSRLRLVSLLIASLRQCAYSNLHALAYVWYARRCVYIDRGARDAMRENGNGGVE